MRSAVKWLAGILSGISLRQSVHDDGPQIIHSVRVPQCFPIRPSSHPHQQEREHSTPKNNARPSDQQPHLVHIVNKKNFRHLSYWLSVRALSAAFSLSVSFYLYTSPNLGNVVCAFFS